MTLPFIFKKITIPFQFTCQDLNSPQNPIQPGGITITTSSGVGGCQEL
jgi:hypothetical protein